MAACALCATSPGIHRTASRFRENRVVKIHLRNPAGYPACGALPKTLPKMRKDLKKVTCARCHRSAAAEKGYPWLVFCGTQVALVWSKTKSGALDTWRKEWFKTHAGFVQAARHEVRARRLTVDDESWIRGAFVQAGIPYERKWQGAIAELKRRAALARKAA